MTFSFEILSRLTFKNMEWNIVRDNYSNLDPFQNINMQAGVSNQVERVLGLYERKRTGVLSEIDEKPERPHDVIRESSLIVRLTYPYADTWIKWLAEEIFSLKRDLPYKKVTKVADFQSVKPRTSTTATKSAVVCLCFTDVSSTKYIC